jgi:hypothetical protein
MGLRRERLGWLLVLGALAGCECNTAERDNFRCGAKLNGVATICDRANEICICDIGEGLPLGGRCAAPRTECESGFGWVFAGNADGGGACVTRTQLSSQLTSKGEKSFCPGVDDVPQRCGGRAANGEALPACAAKQECLCGAKSPETRLNLVPLQCVFQRPECDGGTGLASAFDGTCLEGASDRRELVLRTPDDPSCPGTESPPRTCGIPGRPGNRDCSLCLCGAVEGSGAVLSLPSFSCLQAELSCRTDGGAGLSDRDLTCLTGAGRESLVLVFDGGACPGFDVNDFRPDGGSDAGVDAGVDAGTTCGISGAPNNAACAPGEACLCGLRDGASGLTNVRYQCVRPDPRCTRPDAGAGFTARADQCVTGARSDDFLLAFDGNACPGFDIGPFRPDAGIDAGIDAGTTCGIPAGPTNASCTTGEACLCELRAGASGSPSVRYACVRADPRCAVRDGGPGLVDRAGSCVTGANTEDLLLAFDNAPCPGFDINQLRPDAGTDGGMP